MESERLEAAPIKAEIAQVRANRRRRRRTLLFTFMVLLVCYVGFYINDARNPRAWVKLEYSLNVTGQFAGGKPSIRRVALATFYLPLNTIHVNVFSGKNAEWNPLWHFR